MPITPEHIVKACKAGDISAFEQLYKRYYRVLFVVALRYSRGREEAEDILQDAFIKIFNNLDSYTGSGSFEGWMKRIVQNTAINHYRGTLKFDLHVTLDDYHEVAEETISDFEWMDAKQILALLSKLPEGYRMIVNLYYIDGYKHREIAELLHISEGASKSQLFKAKAYLKKLLHEHINKEVI